MLLRSTPPPIVPVADLRRSVEFLVVGAGPTGLGAAQRFDELGVDWHLVEAAADAGGLAGSFTDEAGFYVGLRRPCPALALRLVRPGDGPRARRGRLAGAPETQLDLDPRAFRALSVPAAPAPSRYGRTVRGPCRTARGGRGPGGRCRDAGALRRVAGSLVWHPRSPTSSCGLTTAKCGSSHSTSWITGGLVIEWPCPMWTDLRSPSPNTPR
jgi:hypothetical protein